MFRNGTIDGVLVRELKKFQDERGWLAEIFRHDELEERYADFPGLNLTFESREGILKHCSPSKAKV